MGMWTVTIVLKMMTTDNNVMEKIDGHEFGGDRLRQNGDIKFYVTSERLTKERWKLLKMMGLRLQFQVTKMNVFHILHHKNEIFYF